MPFISDIPPAIEERVMCSIVAAVKYEIPANIVLAVAAQEGGKPGQWVKNKNGTYDVGPLQFNTKYLNDLEKYGITAKDVEKSGCYPYELAAWRIRGHVMNDDGDLWTRVANYHSRTPEYNRVYRAGIIQRATEWADWLDERYNTYSVTQSAITTRSKNHASETAIIQTTEVNAPSVELQHNNKPKTTNNELMKVAQFDYVPRKLTIHGAQK